AAVRPGATAEGVHATAVEVLVEGLLELKLLSGSRDGVIEQGAYRHLYMHRTGHWLGLDVHDVGAYRLGEHPVELEEGMVLTVEPGLYVSDRLPVPEGQPAIEEGWKGIGIRIEDDVAVSAHGHEVLTAAALKSPAAMERGGRLRSPPARPAAAPGRGRRWRAGSGRLRRRADPLRSGGGPPPARRPVGGEAPPPG
ncbi:MAG: M24 family metallopeptidase, partial [Synechococcus sp.]